MSARVRFLDEVSSNKDILLFIGLFLFGVVWVGVCRLGFGGNALIAVIGPLIALLAYAVLLLFKGFQLREDRAADNLYYLGFLYTLVSLGIGLIKYQSELDGVTNIINDLGVGLTTTVVGLFLRITFLQLRVDPDEASEDARIQLSKALGEFRQDVGEMTNISREAQTIFKQQVYETVDQLNTTTVALASSALELGKSVDDLGLSISNVDVPSDLFTTRFDDASANLETALEASAEKLTRADFGLDLARERITSGAAAVLQALQLFSDGVGEIDIDQSTLLGQVDEQTAEVITHLRSVLPAIDDLSIKIDQATKGFSGNIGTIERIPAQLTAAYSHISKATQSLGVGTSNIDLELKSVVAEISKAKAEASNMTLEIHALVGAFSSALQRLVEIANSSSEMEGGFGDDQPLVAKK